MKLSDQIKSISLQQVGGALSLLGSGLVAFTGNTENVQASALFVGAGLSLTFRGNRPLGYSVGMAGIALGDYILAGSPALSGNPQLQTALKLSALTFALGVLYAPASAAVEFCKNEISAERMSAFTKAIPHIVGMSSVIPKAPGLISAFTPNGIWLGPHSDLKDIVLAAAMSCWAASDVLTGRVHEGVQDIARGARRAAGAIRKTIPKLFSLG